MRIGVTVPNVHETLAERTTIEAVGRMADELGFDSIWCNDHLAIPSAGGDSAAEPAYAAAYGEQRGQSIYEPLIVLAYLAAVTRHVLLGTSVLIPFPAPPSPGGGQAGRLARPALRRAAGAGGRRRLAGEQKSRRSRVSYRQRGRRTDEAIAMFIGTVVSRTAPSSSPSRCSDPRPPAVDRRAQQRGRRGAPPARRRLAPVRISPSTSCAGESQICTRSVSAPGARRMR